MKSTDALLGADHERSGVLRQHTYVSPAPEEQREARELWKDLQTRYPGISPHDLKRLFADWWEDAKFEDTIHLAWRRHLTAVQRAWRWRQAGLLLTLAFWLGLIVSRQYQPIPGWHLLTTLAWTVQTAVWVWGAGLCLALGTKEGQRPGFCVSACWAMITAGMAISELSAWLGVDGIPNPED